MSGTPTQHHWHLVDADAGLFEKQRATRSGWPLRTVVLRLAGGKLLAYSPTRDLSAEAHGELRALGKVSHLVAPNHWHHLGLRQWQEHHPGSQVVASEVAAPRMLRKARVEAAPPSELALPEHVRVLACEGSKAGEVWLRVETRSGVAWVVCDAFFNLAGHPDGLTGLVTRVTGTTAGLRIGGTYPALHLRDREVYRDWLIARIRKDRPRMLIPSHGDVLVADDLPDRLLKLARSRL